MVFINIPFGEKAYAEEVVLDKEYHVYASDIMPNDDDVIWAYDSPGPEISKSITVADIENENRITIAPSDEYHVQPEDLKIVISDDTSLNYGVCLKFDSDMFEQDMVCANAKHRGEGVDVEKYRPYNEYGNTFAYVWANDSGPTSFDASYSSDFVVSNAGFRYGEPYYDTVEGYKSMIIPVERAFADGGASWNMIDWYDEPGDMIELNVTTEMLQEQKTDFDEIDHEYYTRPRDLKITNGAASGRICVEYAGDLFRVESNDSTPNMVCAGNNRSDASFYVANDRLADNGAKDNFATATSDGSSQDEQFVISYNPEFKVGNVGFRYGEPYYKDISGLNSLVIPVEVKDDIDPMILDGIDTDIEVGTSFYYGNSIEFDEGVALSVEKSPTMKHDYDWNEPDKITDLRYDGFNYGSGDALIYYYDGWSGAMYEGGRPTGDEGIVGWRVSDMRYMMTRYYDSSMLGVELMVEPILHKDKDLYGGMKRIIKPGEEFIAGYAECTNGEIGEGWGEPWSVTDENEYPDHEAGVPFDVSYSRTNEYGENICRLNVASNLTDEQAAQLDRLYGWSLGTESGIDVVYYYDVFVNYELDGGENDPDNPSKFISKLVCSVAHPCLDTHESFDDKAFLPATKEGLRFAGWYLDADYQEPVKMRSELGSNNTVTLYAKFVEASADEDTADDVNITPEAVDGVDLPNTFDGIVGFVAILLGLCAALAVGYKLNKR